MRGPDGDGASREHASRWAAIVSIAAKIGCASHTLNDWLSKADVDSGKRAGISAEVAERLNAPERENRELRQANEILRKASAFVAQAKLDRRSKPRSPSSTIIMGNLGSSRSARCC